MVSSKRKSTALLAASRKARRDASKDLALVDQAPGVALVPAEQPKRVKKVWAGNSMSFVDVDVTSDQLKLMPCNKVARHGLQQTGWANPRADGFTAGAYTRSQFRSPCADLAPFRST